MARISWNAQEDCGLRRSHKMGETESAKSDYLPRYLERISLYQEVPCVFPGDGRGIGQRPGWLECLKGWALWKEVVCVIWSMYEVAALVQRNVAA